MASDDAALAEVADEVSDALQASDADLLMAVKNLAPLWVGELAAAREEARQQQSAILARRVDLRDAFVHGAKLTEALGTGADRSGGGSGAGGDALRRPASPISRLAASKPAAAAIALRNISHTLHLLRFLEAAPELIKSATDMLDRVAEEAPESSDLFQAHENICVCVRVRDYTLLDALPNFDFAKMVADIFSGLDSACEQLEHYLIANIFSAVPRYAQTDPRVLVAAVRIVQRDRDEDDWWEQFLEDGALQSAGQLVRRDGRRDYERRMHDAIVKSIEHVFSRRPSSSVFPSVDGTLSWLKKLVDEEQESRRFVVPCFPPAYEIGDLYTTEYHRWIMVVITDLFRATGDRSAAEHASDGDDSDVVKIVEWYREYRWGPSGAALAASSLELPTSQRDRLVAAVARHGKAKLLAKVHQVVATDAASVIWHKSGEAEGEEERSMERSSVASGRSSGDMPIQLSAQKQADTGICTTAGPERVFGAIGQQVKDARVLGVPAVNTALAHVVKIVLKTYQDEIRQLLAASSPATDDWEDYVCATANNMARCLEYAEELREAMSPFVVDDSRMELEEEMEEVIDGFRDIAAIAVAKLADAVSTDAMPQTARFFAPRTGTEVMLDVLGVLGSYFSRYQRALMAFHFETFAAACLRHVVTQYLTPFTTLSHFPNPSPSIPSISGLPSMGAGAIIAQMDKDAEHLLKFFGAGEAGLEKKHVDVPAAALAAARALLTCRPTTQFLAAAHAAAARAATRLAPELSLAVDASEALWRARSDVKVTTALEAGARARREATAGEAAALEEVGAGDAGELPLLFRPRRGVRRGVCPGEGKG
jgi:Exocyst complex component Sec6